MTIIDSVRGREVIDSRGNPTVEVEVVLESGAHGRAAVPSGASTGTREAVELRDGDKGRFGGKGVLKAVAAVNGEIADALRGHDALDQIATDRILRTRWQRQQGPARRQRDPRRQPRLRQGAADDLGLPLWRYVAAGACVLPLPMMNVINGGAHADNAIDFQEFMVMPVGAETFSDSLRMGAEIFHSLKKALKDAGHNTNVGDGGGFAPDLPSTDEALAFLVRAVEAAGFRPARMWCSRSTQPRASSSRTAAMCSQAKGGHWMRLAWCGSTRSCAAVIRSSRSRTAWPRATGTGGRR